MKKPIMIEKEEKVRSNNFARYILVNGILTFSLPTVFLIHTVLYYLDHGLDAEILRRFLSAEYLLFFLSNVLILGVFYAMITWVPPNKRAPR